VPSGDLAEDIFFALRAGDRVGAIPRQILELRTEYLRQEIRLRLRGGESKKFKRWDGGGGTGRSSAMAPLFGRGDACDGGSWLERSSLSFPDSFKSVDVVACGGGYTSRSYLLYRPDFSRRVAYVRCIDPSTLLQELRRMGVQVLYYSPSDSQQRDLLRSCIRSGDLLPLEHSFYQVLGAQPEGR